MIAQTEVAYSCYVNVVGEIRASRKRNFQIQVVVASLSDVCYLSKIWAQCVYA
jgi:hypothetical protein